MSAKDKTSFLGLGKTLFNSSVAVIRPGPGDLDIELFLTERTTRKKASGAWPEEVLKKFEFEGHSEFLEIAENRDGVDPFVFEELLNKQFPFFEHLKMQNLQKYSRHFNKDIQWTSHHHCHASAAQLISPFEKALILVTDGAGSCFEEFPKENPERINFPVEPHPDGLRSLESQSVYLMEAGKLKCVEKDWQIFINYDDFQEHWLSHGLGSLYEKTAEFIFNDKRASGKVMGLASFGRAFQFKDRVEFLKSLDWSKSFKGKGKKEWQSSPNRNLWADIAASVQKHFEDDRIQKIKNLKSRFPEYKNLILTGGCALNCSTNQLLSDLKIFDQIFVPPFPGDESIGLGAAAALYFRSSESTWMPRPMGKQTPFFGPRSGIPTGAEIEKEFAGYKLHKPESLETFVAEKIARGQIIGWFQGASESGPRALGHRSLLARADIPGIKANLNTHIKKREDFRPYGCSVVQDKASKYFEVPEDFESPFMSFAVRTRKEFLAQLEEVCHIDGTSRIQTLHPAQNPQYHQLICEIGRLTGFYLVLNTSLNDMGEPIVESISDARRFLQRTSINGLAIGSYYIEKPTL